MPARTSWRRSRCWPRLHVRAIAPTRHAQRCLPSTYLHCTSRFAEENGEGILVEKCSHASPAQGQRPSQISRGTNGAEGSTGSAFCRLPTLSQASRPFAGTPGLSKTPHAFRRHPSLSQEPKPFTDSQPFAGSESLSKDPKPFAGTRAFRRPTSC